MNDKEGKKKKKKRGSLASRKIIPVSENIYFTFREKIFDLQFEYTLINSAWHGTNDIKVRRSCYANGLLNANSLGKNKMVGEFFHLVLMQLYSFYFYSDLKENIETIFHTNKENLIQKF